MSNPETASQKLVNLRINEAFLEEIDNALRELGYSDRSTFIRDAVMEKLQAMGLKIPRAYALAPSRKGKGGRKRKTSPAQGGTKSPRSGKKAAAKR